MATKDFIYLALIALAAVVFYFHGYIAGIADRRRNTKAKAAPAPLKPNVQVTSVHNAPQLDTVPQRGSAEPLKIVNTVHCFFGNN